MQSIQGKNPQCLATLLRHGSTASHLIRVTKQNINVGSFLKKKVRYLKLIFLEETILAEK